MIIFIRICNWCIFRRPIQAHGASEGWAGRRY